MRISRLFKRLRPWRSQAFRKRHSPAAFGTCGNAGNSVLTAEGTTSKGTGSISCEVEFCIFYRLSLRTLRTKDVGYFSQFMTLFFALPHSHFAPYSLQQWHSCKLSHKKFLSTRSVFITYSSELLAHCFYFDHLPTTFD
jgi:hypothetical protein